MKDERLHRLYLALTYWRVRPHELWCATRAARPCDCGSTEEYECRALARRLVAELEQELHDNSSTDSVP